MTKTNTTITEPELSRDEYLARWGDSERWPTTTKELEEWERDIDAYRRGLGKGESVVS